MLSVCRRVRSSVLSVVDMSGAVCCLFVDVSGAVCCLL